MKTTKEGKRFLLAAFFVGIAALNTGNNLMYLVFSLMLSFLLLSVLILKINLSGLLLNVQIPHPLYAGQRHHADFQITNKKRFIPSYSINILSSCIPSRVYFGTVPGGRDEGQRSFVHFRKRGLYSYGDFLLQSSFPFILFTKTVKVSIPDNILVYPELEDVDDILTGITGREETPLLRTVGRGDELQYLRSFRTGDDRRNIHWKASAKASVLQIKEFAEHEARNITVKIDNLLPEESELFEKAVSVSASVCRSFLKMGYLVRVVTCGKIVPFGGGEEQLFRILDLLAIIKQENVRDCYFQPGDEGTSVTILKNPASYFNQFVSPNDTVLYAGDL